MFPEAFLRAMSAEDRRAIGQPTMGGGGKREQQRGQERELKRDVLNWLQPPGLPMCSTQGMHTRTRRPVWNARTRVCAGSHLVSLAIELQGKPTVSSNPPQANGDTSGFALRAAARLWPTRSKRRDRGHLENQEGREATRRTGKGEQFHNVTTQNAIAGARPGG